MQLMAVAVQLGPTLQVGEAELLFEGQYFIQSNVRSYDVSPDGQRFVMIKPSGPGASESAAGPEVILIQDWFEELKRLVPGQ